MSERVRVRAAWAPDGGWIDGACIEIQDGRITTVSAATAGAGDSDDPILDGYAVPGIPNLHGHAFQRAMAGHAQHSVAGREDDSFWTWREAMYAVAERVGPHQLEVIAEWLQLEMLRAGYTELGEFHYLHRSDEGRERAREMAAAHVAAARRTGMRLCLLPVVYLHGGFGERPLSPRQARFGHAGVDDFLALHELLAADTAAEPTVSLGIAPHSLRAVALPELRALVAALPASMPFHIHVAEQPAEVDDCLEHHGRRPVRLLLDEVGLDRRWCAVHATHMVDDELRDLASSGAVAGVCPTTEADLGDGVFSARAWLEAGGGLGIGSDSHVAVDPAEELRLLEYGQRLTSGRRNVLSGDGAAAARGVGRRLLDAVVDGGRRALGGAGTASGLAPGAPADFVVLDAAHPALAAHGPASAIEGWVFGGGGRDLVRDVFVAGRHVVRDRAHERVDAARSAFTATCRSLFSGEAR